MLLSIGPVDQAIETIPPTEDPILDHPTVLLGLEALAVLRVPLEVDKSEASTLNEECLRLRISFGPKSHLVFCTLVVIGFK